MRGEGQLLVDHGDAPLARPGAGRSVGLAVEGHGAGVGADGAAENFHQGGLAGAVLTDEGVDFTWPQFQVHAAQGVRRPERL